MAYNSAQDFLDYYRLTTEDASQSEVETYLEQADDWLDFQIPQITDSSYPWLNVNRLATVLRILASAELYYAMGLYLRAATFSERFAKLDQNILAVAGLSRGADTPSPLEAADWWQKMATAEIDRAKELLKLVKPKPWMVSKMAPSTSYWSIIT